MKKKIHMISALLAMLLPTVQAWGSSNYYAYTKVVRGTGCGKVYVSASTTANPDYKTNDYTSDAQGGKDKSKTEYKLGAPRDLCRHPKISACIFDTHIL